VQASNWPLVLAGPIVRRVEPNLASVWVALKQPATIRLEIWHGLETAATAWPPWRMFSLSTDPRQAASSAVARDYLFLPPALGPTLQGQAVEEVLTRPGAPQLLAAQSARWSAHLRRRTQRWL